MGYTSGMRPLIVLTILFPLLACDGARIDRRCVMDDPAALGAIEHIQAARAAARPSKWTPDAEGRAHIAVLAVRVAACTKGR